MSDRRIDALDEAESLRLIATGGVGRIAYTSRRFGLVVLPVNYRLHDGAVVFRTAEHGPLDDDLRTGISEAEYKVTFEIDEIDMDGRRGWSVMIQGPAHHITGSERAESPLPDIDTWPPGDRELYIKIVPSRVTGRRISPV
jgi:nitroimidazol reductase NimA-like FMN-containing flavoprotein (pyridoxamine 5'-phosphate oxidase superfamily)